MTSLELTGAAISVLILLYVIKNTPFTPLIDDKRIQHRVFGATTALFVLWLFRVSIYDGLVMHFLGLTAFTLVVGFRYALIAGGFALLASTIVGYESFERLGINYLFGVFVPVAFSYVVYMFTFHKMTRHLFVYLFACGFFAGGASIAIKMLLMSGYFWVEGLYEWSVIHYNYTQMIYLLVFQEAFFNGMLMTCLVVYKPDWIYTFSDKFYLDGK